MSGASPTTGPGGPGVNGIFGARYAKALTKARTKAEGFTAASTSKRVTYFGETFPGIFGENMLNLFFFFYVNMCIYIYTIWNHWDMYITYIYIYKYLKPLELWDMYTYSLYFYLVGYVWI